MAVPACDGPPCPDGQVPNDHLQSCVTPPLCDAGAVNERNECVLEQATQKDDAGRRVIVGRSGPDGGLAGRAGGGGAGHAGGSEADAGMEAGMGGEVGGAAAAGQGGSMAAACGDGHVDPGEECDGNCPTERTECPAPNACERVVLNGSAAKCDARCETSSISMCANGDGCCPLGCKHANDTDCSATCGDGVLDEGETCEPRSVDHPCPTRADCDDGNPCTDDKLSGSVEQCNVLCAPAPLSRMPIDCDDGNPCTDDKTVESSTSCTYECVSSSPRRPTGSCDDDDPCTDDTPVMSATSCAVECPHKRRQPPAANCADNDPCTDDAPVLSTTSCEYECPHKRRQPPAANCDDGNPCTDDTPAMSTTSCAYECPWTPAPAGTACGGGRMCSREGVCQAPPAPVCGDGMVEAGEACEVTDKSSQWSCVACQQSRMYTGCLTGNDCDRSTPLCHVPTGVSGGACTASCSTDANCPAPLAGLKAALCVAGQCKPTCTRGDDCPAGTACVSGTCRP